MLVYECSKLLEKHFGVVFGFEEIIKLIHIMEKDRYEDELTEVPFDQGRSYIYSKVVI